MALNGFMEQSGNSSYYEGIWNAIRKDAAEKGIPIHGHFELTPQCNLNCKMCYVHLQKAQMNEERELSFDQWKKIIDGAIDNGMIFASLSGGECLLYPEFDKIYTYLNSKGIIITVLTNGVLLESKLELFKKYPPSFIQISVYGLDEDTYERVTGFRKCNKVLETIQKAISYNLPIGISVTCSKYLTQISDIVAYFKKINIGVAVNKWLMPPYDMTGRKLNDFNLSIDDNIEISIDLYRLTENQNPIPFVGKLPTPNNCCDTNRRGLTCAAGRSDFSINWKGEMSMCVALNTITGYPLQEPFKIAWENTNLSSKSFLMPCECIECEYHKVCNYCPAQHLVDSKPGHCSTKVCEETVRMVQSGLLVL